MWPLALFALTALLGNLILHVAVILGFDPLDCMVPEWAAVMIFWGVFGSVMLLANVVEARRTRRARAAGVALAEPVSPWWFKLLMGLVIVNALLGPLVAGWPGVSGGEPVRLADGSYAMDPGHGRTVVPITEGQFHAYHSSGVRILSGLLLIFYFQIAFHFVCLARGRCLRAAEAGRPHHSGRWILMVWTWPRN